MLDLIQHHHGCPRPTANCLDSGFVSLVDVMPGLSRDENSLGCEAAIVQAARVSYGAGTKTLNEDRGLIRYCMRHTHTTPFEMVEFKFHIAVPLTIARQWLRHRTANVNEQSGRYSEMPDRFYFPAGREVRKQSEKNKQGGDLVAPIDDARDFLDRLDRVCGLAYTDYEVALARGIAREQARFLLPQNLYTEFFWKIDLHNLLHFLKLRADSHAQQEIRVYADAILALITPLVPTVIEAWNDYEPMRGAVKLTRLEWARLKRWMAEIKPLENDHDEPMLSSGNKREDEEWQAKLADLLGK